MQTRNTKALGGGPHVTHKAHPDAPAPSIHNHMLCTHPHPHTHTRAEARTMAWAGSVSSAVSNPRVSLFTYTLKEVGCEPAPRVHTQRQRCNTRAVQDMVLPVCANEQEGAGCGCTGGGGGGGSGGRRCGGWKSLHPTCTPLAHNSNAAQAHRGDEPDAHQQLGVYV